MPVLVYMRKPRYLMVGADYHVTAKINLGEFTLKKGGRRLKKGDGGSKIKTVILPK